LPKIDAASLVQLEILNAPDLFELEMLVDSKGSETIELSNLVRFKLAYQNTYDKNSDSASEISFISDKFHEIKYLFPRLESLELFIATPDLVDTVICSGHYRWPNVSSLVLSNLSEMLNNFYDIDEIQFGKIELNGNTIAGKKRVFEARIVKGLQQSMPLLSKLSFDLKSYSPSDSIMYNQMASHFASNLVSLNIGPRSIFDFPQFSKNLVSLCISALDETWLHFPFINTRVLQHLRLKSVPYNQFWKIFENSAETDNLQFNSLTSLSISFNYSQIPTINDIKELTEGGSSQSGSKKKLSVFCPRLQKIHIFGVHFCGLWNIFANINQVWSSVDTLLIASTNFGQMWDSVINNLSADKKMWLKQKLEFLNSQIKIRVPNVSSLEINLFNATADSNLPFTKLVHAYSAQLKRLECDIPVKTESLDLSDSLHTLEFAVDENSRSGFRSIKVEKMEKLGLKNLPSDFSWRWFKCNSSVNNISFSRLYSLNMEIRDRDQSISAGPIESLLENHLDLVKSRQQVFMPNLRSANIHIGRQGSANWDADIYMGNLFSFSLQGVFSGIAPVCWQIFFKNVRHYRMSISLIEKDDEDLFYKTTNYLFNDLSCFNHATLFLPQLPFDIDIDAIRWTRLTLFNCVKARFETVTELLPKLTNLKRLEYTFLPDYFPDIANIVSRVEDADSRDVFNDMVLSQSVNSIYLSIAWKHSTYSSVEEDQEESAVACCTYLLLLMPNLNSASIGNPVNWELEDIVEGFVDMFPHLDRLRD
ncbi:hypothetical protein J3B02_000272, partial [Coemansia erecta]